MTSLIPAVYSPSHDLAGVAGRVVTGENSDYDQMRAVFYGGIDMRPSAIVRVVNVEDVQRAVATARDEGYELAVRSGGHSPIGPNTNHRGPALHLPAMAAHDIHARARPAWVQAAG